jgi:hypothetical protein
LFIVYESVCRMGCLVYDPQKPPAASRAGHTVGSHRAKIDSQKPPAALG